MARTTLLIGGNLGDVATTLRQARGMIGERVGEVVRSSGVSQSEPWGFEAPQSFLNQVLVVETALAPEALLDALEQIERELGRVKTPGRRGGPYRSRTIDIDILYYDDLQLETPRLTIPHPLIDERDFVLELLAQI